MWSTHILHNTQKFVLFKYHIQNKGEDTNILFIRHMFGKFCNIELQTYVQPPHVCLCLRVRTNSRTVEHIISFDTKSPFFIIVWP
jgi:hypothetical protein